MMRRPVTVLVFLLALVACGPSQRHRTLTTMFNGATAAQAGFIEWDRKHLEGISDKATSEADLLQDIANYRKASKPVADAFEGVYRTLAAAALLDEDQASLVSAVGAFEQLRLALSSLTGGRLP